jgi:hypothetical protein
MTEHKPMTRDEMLGLVAEAKRLDAARETQCDVVNDGGEYGPNYGVDTIIAPRQGRDHHDRVFVTFNQHFDCEGDSEYLVAAWNNYADLARAVEVLDLALYHVAIKRMCGACRHRHTDCNYIEATDCSLFEGERLAYMRRVTEQAAAELAARKQGGE